MADDPPLPLSLATPDDLLQLAALQNPQPSLAPYDPDRPFASPPSNEDGETMDSQPVEVDYLAELRKITANATARPRKDAADLDSGDRPTVRTSGPAPSAILQWAPALRHVTRIGMTNPEFQTAIQKMIAEQRSHEEQWWAAREKLLSPSTPPESRGAELARYDSKVHHALLEMQQHMGQRLGELGVPFFGVDPSLVVDHSDAADASKISRSKLDEFRRRMLETLEAIYGPE